MMQSKRLVMGITVFSLLLMSGTAFAKKKKGKSKNDDGIRLTEVKSFDKVFRQVSNIDKRLSSTEKSIKSSRVNLNSALGLKKGTPINDAIAELKKRGEGKLQVSLTKGMAPKITTKDAVPSNLSAAIDSLNAMTANFSDSIKSLAGVQEDSKNLVSQVTAFPANLKDEFKDTNGLLAMVFKFPKITKNLTHNIKVTQALPKRSSKVVGRMTSVVSTVQHSFTPVNSGKKGVKRAPRKPGNGKKGGYPKK